MIRGCFSMSSFRSTMVNKGWIQMKYAMGHGQVAKCEKYFFSTSYKTWTSFCCASCYFGWTYTWVNIFQHCFMSNGTNIFLPYYQLMASKGTVETDQDQTTIKSSKEQTICLCLLFFNMSHHTTWRQFFLIYDYNYNYKDLNFSLLRRWQSRQWECDL